MILNPSNHNSKLKYLNYHLYNIFKYISYLSFLQKKLKIFVFYTRLQNINFKINIFGKNVTQNQIH
jgi:hypothetical protein